MSAVFADAEALSDLRRGLLDFARRQAEVLEGAQAGVERLWAQLEDLEAYRRAAVNDAEDAVQQCYAEAEEAAAYGFYVDCWFYQQQLEDAQRRLEAVHRQQERLREAARRFAGAARSMRRSLEQEVPRATAFLDRRIRAVEAACALEIATGLPALAAIAAQHNLPGVMTGVVGAVKHSRGEFTRLLGAEGEDVAAAVLSQRFGLTPLPYDQPVQGFDRVFRAPGLPLIVVESKVSSDGKLRLGQPQSGEQGSPAWVAAQAQRMIDPASAAHSPANERIALLVDELGPENVPVVTVVVNPTTRRADLYLRGRDGAWQLLEGGVDLPAEGGA